jgi:non-homologous end joining protein Ku
MIACVKAFREFLLAPSPKNVVNLMDALKRSLAAKKAQAGKPGKATADRRRKPERARS